MKFRREIVEAAFSTARAARLTGLSPRQLDYWDRRGLLRPSLSEAAGYGSSRRYSFADVVRLRVAARLRSAGFGLRSVRQAMDTLRRLDPQHDPLTARLVLSEGRMLWVRSGREVVDLLDQGQLMLVFPVAREAEAVASAVRRLEREEEELSPAPRRAGGRGR